MERASGLHRVEERASQEGRLIRVLTVNAGSSSVKAAVYALDGAETRVGTARVERIGLPIGRLAVDDGQGRSLVEHEAPFADHDAALVALFAALEEAGLLAGLDVVAHRIVHGGAQHHAPALVTPPLLTALGALADVDPDHAPQALAGIRFVARAHPALPQVVCFDTAFHRTLPPVARRYALPRRLADEGLVRYGFHGLSYEYVVGVLRGLEGPRAGGRVIVAHLGNGASMAAIHDGRSVDTSMGFTPVAGLVMGTRAGDVDPGLVLHLLAAQGMTPAAVAALLNKESGLRGVSGTSEDMRDLLARAASDPHAAEAVELFCYRARAYVGAYAAVLGGLDVLVFTGGIGEHAPAVRARICAGLEFLGIELDPPLNAADAPLLSGQAARVRVRVIATNEELMIARHAATVLRRAG